MKIIIPTYNRGKKVIDYIMQEQLTDLEIVDDASTNFQILDDKDFEIYCKKNNIKITRNKKNLGLIGNHISIAANKTNDLLFMINDDDYISKVEIIKLKEVVKNNPNRYFLKINENYKKDCRELNFYSNCLKSKWRIFRLSAFLFNQHDWLLHGVIYGKDFNHFKGFNFFKSQPDMWGRVVTFRALLSGGIAQLPIYYSYKGDSSKFYKKEKSSISILVFLLTRLFEVHLNYFTLCIKGKAYLSSLLVPFALFKAYIGLFARSVRAILKLIRSTF